MVTVAFRAKFIDSKTHARYVKPMYIAREVIEDETISLTYSTNPDRAMRFDDEEEAKMFVQKHIDLDNLAPVPVGMPEMITNQYEAIINEIF